MLESLKKIMRETALKEQKACFKNTKIRMIDEAASAIKEINPNFDQDAFVIKMVDAADKAAEEMAKIGMEFKELLINSTMKEREALKETKVSA